MARVQVLSLSSVLLALLSSVAQVRGLAICQAKTDARILTDSGDIEKEYDYIVVGGGTSGLTVADRLSESGDYTVLVIELGLFDNSTEVNTIAGGIGGISNPGHLFSFPSEPQVHLQNRTTSVVGGVMLGGSSGVNGLQVHRGHKDDYDRWGKFFSDDSEWSWEGLLPYFKKAWHFHPPNDDTAKELDIKYDEKYWGTESGIHASFPTFNWPGLRIGIEAFGDIEGAKLPRDSGAGIPGAYWYPTSADPTDMTRSMSRKGHFDGLKRENYVALTGHRVLNVLFDDEDTATGVRYVTADATDDKKARKVKAKKEVIIAAGTIHTPQILQGSGIGAKALLKKAGIDVRVNLPGVGWNLQDHPLGGGATFTLRGFNQTLDPNSLTRNVTFRREVEAEFEEFRTGPLTIASGNAACFLPLPVVAPARFQEIADTYEAQDPAAYLPQDSPSAIVRGYEAQKKAMAAAMRSHNSGYYNLFLRGSNTEGNVVFLHPASRGSVSIRPENPYFGEPSVDYRTLSNPVDVAIEIEFVRFTRRYMTESRMRDYDPVESRPGEDVVSDEAITEFLESAISPSTFHPVGTAAMLPRRLAGVVDEQLSVYGVKGLSVVDASIMPDLPGAYTQATVYAIAEKAADLIKARA